MANADTPRGFSATGTQYGLEPVSVDASNTTAVFRGDVMSGETDGNAVPAAADDVTKIGIAHGATAATTDAKSLLAATTAGTIMLSQDPMQQYVVQSASTTVATQNMIFAGCDHVAGAGSAITGLSGHELDLSAPSTTVGGFVLLDFSLRPDNSVDGTTDFNVDCVVRMNVGEGILSLAAGPS
jgi:hypothetical protein